MDPFFLGVSKRFPRVSRFHGGRFQTQLEASMQLQGSVAIMVLWYKSCTTIFFVLLAWSMIVK